MLFLQDNSPPHTSQKRISKITQSGFRISSLFTIFPGLGSNRLIFVPKLQNVVRWKKLLSNQDVVTAVNGRFSDFGIYFLDKMKKLEYY